MFVFQYWKSYKVKVVHQESILAMAFRDEEAPIAVRLDKKAIKFLIDHPAKLASLYEVLATPMDKP